MLAGVSMLLGITGLLVNVQKDEYGVDGLR